MMVKYLKYYFLLVAIFMVSPVYAQFTLQAGGGYSNYQWYNVSASGASPISGATMSNFVANMPGVYYATFDGTNCGTNATEYFVLTANNDTTVVLNANQNNVNYNWYKDNNSIIGANADSLNIVSNSTLAYYQAEIVQNGCTKLLPGFHVYHLGVWAPLPIELLYFNAVLSADESKVVCTWETKSEINTDYFIVEKSLDQVNWEFVSQLPAAGNSSQTLSYSTYDYKPHKGRSYYRLKTTDIDNSFTYSNIRSVYIGQKELQYVRIYPNPFTDKIVIEGPEEEFEILKIYNSLGDVVRNIHYTDLQTTTTKKEIDVSSLAAGLYFIRTKSTSTKLMKMD